jgi:RNA polymerase sigma-70 factor, ECF subfamily
MNLMPSPPVINNQSTDSAIFSAMQAQQMQALDLLYDRYSKLVYSVAVRILNNIEEAEEVTQETFLRLWQRNEIYQPHRGSLSGFLITLTRSRSIDRVRSRTSRHRLHERLHTTCNDVTHSNPPLEAATTAERTQLVHEAFKQLSAAERQLLEIAYYEA